MRSIALAMLWLTATGAAQDVARLQVLPADVSLHGTRDRVQLVVLGELTDGAIVDLTEEARVVAEDGRIARAEGSVVHPRADGVTALSIAARGASAHVGVTVADADRADPVRFRTEMLAVLTRQGCNAGSCHGSPSGKGGLSLSLFAFDPEQDLRVLTRDALARRTNVLEPDASLLLKKPLLRAPHVGGKRLRIGEEPHEIVRQWIADGCRPDPAAASHVVDLTVEPPRALRRLEHGATQRLRVVATFADATQRDVTHLAAFETTNRAVATVDEHGLVRSRSIGDATIMVRYLDRIATADLTFTQHVDGFVWPHVEEHNVVDQLVNARLRQREVVPAPTCADETFVRRLWLDLTGLLPPVAEVEAFVSSDAHGKRAALIDRLLASDAHARFWARKLADVLKVSRATLKERAPEYADWLEVAYRDGLPHDRLARELLTGSGTPSLYYVATTEATDLVETTTQVFLGSRLGCAKCHNHPFESWTQDDYFRIAAAFVPGTEHPLREREMTPWPFDADADAPADAASRRAAFAEWMTSADNPWFARVAVNRIWAELFGRGIVDPVDDFRASNPPSDPALLDALADAFVASGFDRRHVLRMILQSATWQRASAPADGRDDDPSLFAHQRPRLLTAEQVHDAVLRVTSEGQRLQADAELARCEAAVAAIDAQLAEDLPRWLAEKRAALASGARPSASVWYACLPFPGGFGDVHAPERSVDLDSPPPERAWVAMPGWNDGEVWTLPLTADASAYLFRTIDVPTDTKATFWLGSDDGLKLFLDGAAVLVRDVARGVAADQDRIEVQLHQGRNEILLRVHNRGGAAGFYFRTDSPLLDEEFVELVTTPEDRLTEPQRVALATRHAAESRAHAEARAALESARRGVDDWFATQTIVPAGEPTAERRALLGAFGAPERTTACACERMDEPTLQQALQVLNGPFVVERLRETDAFLDMTDDALIDHVWLAALARRPDGPERTTAQAFLAAGDDRAAAVQDLIWAVLAKKEFLFQH